MRIPTWKISGSFDQPRSRSLLLICSRAPVCVTPYTVVITVCFTSLRSMVPLLRSSTWAQAAQGARARVGEGGGMAW